MMNKIFCRSFKSPWAILYFASVIIMFYYYKGYNIPIEVWIMNTHYIPVYLNTAFIIFSIRKARDYENVYIQSIIRLGRLKYVTELIKSGIYNVIFYHLSSIALISTVYAHRVNSFLRLGMYIVITGMLFFFFELIYIEVIIREWPRILMVSPIIINILAEIVFYNFSR